MAKESDEVMPGEQAITINQSIKDFNSAVRWTMARGVRQDKEWYLKTSYCRKNRLTPLGITNKHAAIRGMPKVSAQQAESVTKEIFIAKGLTKSKKQKIAWGKAEVTGIARPFYYKRRAPKHRSGQCLTELAGTRRCGHVAHFGRRYET